MTAARKTQFLKLYDRLVADRRSNSKYDENRHRDELRNQKGRIGLQPLPARDASHDVQHLARALNFHTPNAAVPDLPHPTARTQAPCIQPDPPTAINLSDSTNPWPRVLDSGLLQGWDLPR